MNSKQHEITRRLIIQAQKELEQKIDEQKYRWNIPMYRLWK